MRANDMYEACADALRAYAEGAGFTDMVVGLSGGIDSSVIAVLCADVFGPDHVHGVMLPGPYSTEHSLDDARELADNLGIETHVVSICEPFAAFEAVLRRLERLERLADGHDMRLDAQVVRQLAGIV